MEQQEIHRYLQRFFLGTGCQVKDFSTHLEVDLTVDMDKKLMNRPFYWECQVKCVSCLSTKLF